MHNGIIFPEFERVPRRFVPLFASIVLDSSDMWAVAISRTGEPDGDGPFESVGGDVLLASKAFAALGTFAERNAKRERKEECDTFAKTSNADDTPSQKSPSSPPEFKIGDLVECLKHNSFFYGGDGRVIRIKRIADHPFWIDPETKQLAVVAFWQNDGETECCHPLRALRHAPVETEPPADEWQEIKWQNKNKKTIGIWQNKNKKTIGVWHLIDGQWDWNGDDLKYPDWPTLKTAIQKASPK